jgi:Fuc2NAc and GlcNAc transferase
MSLWFAPIAALFAAALTGAVRRYALRTGLLDRPNERSSHVTATPRGGGIAVVTTVVAGALVAWATGALPAIQGAAFVVASLAVATVGYLDDRRGLSARARLIVHLAAAAVCVVAFGVRPVPLTSGPFDGGGLAVLIAVIGTVWSINLFNFMDGTDGIAASQAVYVFLAAASLDSAIGRCSELDGLLVTTAAGAAGFLVWNLPPARIFMGDVGSGFLGFVLAILAIATSGDAGVSVWTWVILNGLFAVDATVTLAVRACRQERLYSAHRDHVYQRLARRWHSHGKVLVLYAAINVLWLLPIAALSVRWPAAGAWLTALATGPLVLAALMLGAGKPDVPMTLAATK